MALNLGKQVGPLPLGAWFVVVIAGVGIALYARQQSVTNEPVEVPDTSGDPGVGTGAVGGWVPTTPGAQSPIQGKPTTNEEWARAAIDHLIAMRYPPTDADAAIRSYIGGAQLSVSQSSLVAIALAALGSPPQPLPPTETPPGGGGGGGGGTGIPAAPSGIKVMPAKTVIQLDWGTVPQAVRYELQRIAPTPGSIVDTDGTEFLFHSLKPNTSYSFQLRAIGVNGRSSWTRINTRTTR